MRFMHQVGVDVRRADGLFDVLDYDESGVLDFKEFVETDAETTRMCDALRKEVNEFSLAFPMPGHEDY